MVLIADGSSEHDAHVGGEIGNSAPLRPVNQTCLYTCAKYSKLLANIRTLPRFYFLPQGHSEILYITGCISTSFLLNGGVRCLFLPRINKIDKLPSSIFASGS